MKKVYLFISFLSLFLASCSNDLPSNDNPTNESSELNVLANIETRALVPGTTFTSSSIIATYIVGKGYAPTQPTPYTFTTEWTSGTPKINLTGNSAVVYGYYPSTAKLTGSTAPTETSTIDATIFTSAKENSFDGSGQTDYLYAIPSQPVSNSTPGTSNKATLNFKHALTKICFIINKDEDYSKLGKDNGDITSIKLSATGNILPTSGTIKIKDGTFTPNTANNSSSIEFTPSVQTFANDYSNPASAKITALGLVAPIPSLESISLEVMIDAKKMNIEGLTGPIKWEPGKTYTYTITVSPTELIIGSVSITDWTVGENVDGLTGK